MRLGDEGDAAAFQALDEPALPQRLVAVELAGQDFADDVGQFLLATGSGQCRTVNVVIQLERWIVDPHRTVQAERHFLDTTAERRQIGQPAVEVITQMLEVESRCVTGIQDHQPQRVLWPFSALHGQEHGIHAGQALHRNTPLVDHGFVAAITYPRLRFRQLLLPSQRDRNSRPISGSPTIRNPATKCTRLAVSFFGQLSQRCLPAIPLLGKYILCAITSAPRRIHRCRAPCRVLRDSRSTSSRSTRPLRR